MAEESARHQPGEQVPIIVSAVEIIDGVEVPIGEPRVRTISRGALDLLHRKVSPLDDRRQRARETFYDMLHDTASDDGPVFELSDCVAGAIETATRVKITPEAVAKFRAVAEGWGGNFAVSLAVALAELGFEVEE